MKKLLVIAFIFVVATFFIIDRKHTTEEETLALKEEETSVSEKRAMFLSYIENEKYFGYKTTAEQQKNMDYIIENMVNSGFNMLIFHVRGFSDAWYQSTIFPWSSSFYGEEGIGPSFDPLEYLIEKAHAHKIEVHAWINPYRIRNTTDIASISEDNPAFAWLSTSNVKVIPEKGIFYNPASEEVRSLIVAGVQEIINRYDIDGIHFDDYFYPDDTIDLDSYQDYQKQGGTKTLSEYRLENVNKLIHDVYQAIKTKDETLVFGVSPEGNIDNNYASNYADVRTWASVEGYVDYLMPQIYFGFENERRPFLETVTMWNDLITAPDVKLLPALAFYKVGTEDQNAKSGAMEWIENDDIIKKEILVSRNLSQYAGFSLFRYDYLFSEDYYTQTTLKEIEHMNEIIR